MSLTTQCPKCLTIFKVVPDQLRISEGWVRCGHCSDVFNASPHLQAVPASNTPNTLIEAKTPRIEAGDADTRATAIAAPPTAVEALDLDSELLRDALHEPVHDAPPLDPTPEPETAHTPESQEPFAAIVESRVDPSMDSVDTTPTTYPSELVSELSVQHSFLRQTLPPSRWNAPWVLGLLTLLGIGLTAVLILQVVHFERNRIAAMFPESKPYLETLCAPVGCNISSYRQIDAVVIESSNFTKVRSDVYQLNVTFRNTGAIEVEVPALELSLTNLQDQAVVRRVFGVVDFVTQATALAPGDELRVSVPVKLVQMPDSERVAGYRLLAFYP